MTDDVVELLRSLPPDLPQPDDRVQQVRARVLNRRRRLAMTTTVLSVLAVTVPLSVLQAGGPAPTGPPVPSGSAPTGAPLACPQVYAGAAPWVPDPPRGVDGQSRLIPPQPPARALLCAYDGDTGAVSQAGLALTGSRELSGGLDRLASDLTLVTRRASEVACTARGGPQVNYLLGLTYDSGTLWVSASDDPNRCNAATNGQFTANYIGEALTASYTAGTWTQPAVPATGYPCTGGPTGRLGQDTLLVPPDPISVEICHESDATTGRRSITLTTGYTDLIDTINQLPTRESGSKCSVITSSTTHYLLLFRYTEGPSVLLHVLPGCQPAIFNGNLGTDDAAPVLTHIEQLLGTG